MTQQAEYKPIPFEERPSQKIGWGQYLFNIAKPLAISFGCAGVGYVIGKQFAPPKFEKESTSAVGAFAQAYMKGLYAGQKDRSIAYMAIGKKIGLFIAAYMLWKKHKIARIAVMDTVQQVKDVATLQMTSEKMEAENNVLSKMVDHEKQKQQAIENPEQASTHYRNLVTAMKEENTQTPKMREFL